MLSTVAFILEGIDAILVPRIYCIFSTRYTGVTRWYIEAWILQEEVSWTKEQRHWFCWHHREILRCREVSEPERMPEHNVRVNNGFGRILHNPCWKPL